MRICPICGKKPNKAVRLIKLRGKYNPTITRYQYPNLQWVKLPSGVKPRGSRAPLQGQRVKVCAKCRKRLLKT